MRTPSPRGWAIAAALLSLAACAPEGGGRNPPPRVGDNPVQPIWETPGPSADWSAAPARATPAAAEPQQQQRPNTERQQRRRSSGTVPDPYGAPATQPPVIVPPPGVPPSNEATAAFKRDLLAPKVQDLRTEDALGRTTPQQQRELLMKQQELHRLETDPLRQ